WFTFFCRVGLMCSLFALSGCSTGRVPIAERRASYRMAEMVEALNALRNDINTRYGFRNGAPRINMGPCGRFARDFRERWDARFREPVTIAFIMADNDASNCFHVLVKLPNGQYYDGGNGVMTAAFLKALYPDGHIEEMKHFDFELLDKRSYGLGRSYPECPNYAEEFTRQMIEQRLSELLYQSRQ
ncbi:MAG TPA: hypothetical protein VGF13_16435, partial [Verrucomicrobiae bacterium]